MTSSTQTPISPYLCDLCQAIQFDDRKYREQLAQTDGLEPEVRYQPDRPRNGRLVHHKYKIRYEREDVLPGLPALSESLCSFCRLLKLEFDEYLTAGKAEGYEKSILKITGLEYAVGDFATPCAVQPWLDSLCVCFKLILEERESSHTFCFDVSALPNDPCAAWLGIGGGNASYSPLSEQRIQRMRDLVANGIGAREQSMPNFAPTRLIDVGDVHREPRLVIPAQYEPFLSAGAEGRRYIALSYCWGSPEEAKYQLKTERRTLQARLNSISLKDFSTAKTLLDAVLVCRALEVRYLWIDSLCIIQCDKDDWEKECPKMVDVYDKAYLTLCVLRGSSCLSGFLQRWDYHASIKVPFQSSVDPSVSGIYSLKARKYRSSSWMTDIHNSSWNTRGWTFQEAEISKNKLIFGQSMMQFCRPGYSESEEGRTQPANPWSHWRGNPSKVNWYHLARGLSTRCFTNRLDTFPAISAFAKLTSESTGERYFAGLWLSDIHRGLLWGNQGRTNFDEFTHLPRLYVAPSWSWASLPYPVYWVDQLRGIECKPEINVEAAEVQVDGQNPFGRVLDGHLDLRTKVHSLKGLNTRRDPAICGFIFPWSFTKRGQYVAHFTLDWMGHPEDCWKVEHRPDGPIEELSMLLISSRDLDSAGVEQAHRTLDSNETMLGLLVRPTQGRSTYKRYGIWFSYSIELGGRKFWDNVPETRITLV